MNALSESTENAFKLLIAAADDRAYFFAWALKEAFGRNDDDAIMRIMVGRSEIDLKDIEEAFKDSFDDELSKIIKEETSGNYQKLLLAILDSGKIQ